MTSIEIPDSDRRIQYIATAGQTVFPYDFPIYDDDDLIVKRTRSGTTTTLTKTTDYTVSGVGVEAGGNVTLGTGATLSDIITIYGSSPIDRQGQNFQQSGDFLADDLNRQLNKQIIISQELQSQIDNCLKLGEESTYSGSLALPTPTANKALLWNSSANALINSTDDFNDIVTDATAQAVIATTQAGISTTQAGLATTARIAAQTAQTNAETAETNAETAETNAEAAQTAAEAARDLAQGYAAAADVDKIEWQGSWSAGTYNISDAVEHNGSSWIATTTTTEEPSGTATDWDLLASKGTDGTGTGDVSSDVTSGTNNKLAKFADDDGKTITDIDNTGYPYMSAGVLGTSDLPIPFVIAGGTVDAITADFTPNLVLADGLEILIRATGANTVTNPTLASDGGSALTIYKTGNTALVAGDIKGADHILHLVYKSATTRWELLNPAASSVTIASSAEAIAGTDNTKMITPLRVRDALNASGSAPVYAPRAWVNFNGQGTVAIRASGNVSSITDNGTGNYTVNFNTAMADTDYAVVMGGSYDTTGTSNMAGEFSSRDYATGSVKVFTISSAASLLDYAIVNVAVFR